MLLILKTILFFIRIKTFCYWNGYRYIYTGTDIDTDTDTDTDT